jgi:hypothetical protein
MTYKKEDQNKLIEERRNKLISLMAVDLGKLNPDSLSEISLLRLSSINLF